MIRGLTMSELVAELIDLKIREAMRAHMDGVPHGGEHSHEGYAATEHGHEHSHEEIAAAAESAAEAAEEAAEAAEEAAEAAEESEEESEDEIAPAIEEPPADETPPAMESHDEETAPRSTHWFNRPAFGGA